jgi:uncharacterized ferritin-like protein (DUF455 family)
VQTVRDYARSILLEGDLEAKLRAPPDDLVDVEHESEIILSPVRDAHLAMHEGSERLPPLNQLTDPSARAQCIARFANHELMATELFAWALLAFPLTATGGRTTACTPAALRRGFLGALADEQTHCRLYLDRLSAHGKKLGDEPLSGYFWKHIDAFASPLAFLCAQGLTLEQANLDFTILYRDAFANAGDHETANVLQRVHDDEISHVKLAATWAKKLAGESDLHAYRHHAPFPFSLARAKARRFEVGARKRAGLSTEMIDAVRAAKPYT